MSYVGRKGARAALIHADIPSNLNLLGDYVKIPSATTTERDALTPAVGMMLYNTTLGIMQQYNATGWASIDSPPTISSFTYPDSQTALDPLGSTTQTLVITGTNFQTGITVTIDGTAPTSTTRNSATQVTITGYPAKSAATYTNGLVVTNPTGLAASVDIAYDAVPAWTTAAGALGTFVDGAYTNSSSSTIRIVAAEGSDTIDYAQVSDATGDTVITSGVAGLTLGTTGANAGYLTGTLNGTDSTTYTFYAKAQDDENQFSAVRSFNIITKDYAATGGVVTTGLSGFRIHTFYVGMGVSFDFVVANTMNIDWLVVGGGGGGAGQMGAGGGAGGFRTGANYSIAAGTHTITVGGGGAGGESANVDGADEGGNSSIASLIVSHGGGGGGGYGGDSTKCLGHDGGSGGGGASGLGTGFAGGSALALNPTQVSGEVTTVQGFDGGSGVDAGGSPPKYNAGGGGGASAAGETPSQGNERGGDGGAGKNEIMGLSAANSKLLLDEADDGSGSAGVLSGSYRYFAGGGGGAAYPVSNGYGAGGLGGGGSEAIGVAHSGGGGGGKQGSPGYAGGSGIVIIRYAV